MPDIKELISLIGETQHYFKQKAQQQVNTALTLRNWLFGFFIVEYELNGADRAEYGGTLFKEIATQLQKQGFNQIRERHLYLCKDFYLAYQNILRTPTAKLYIADFESIEIFRSVSAKLTGGTESVGVSQMNSVIDPNQLINQLSFSHFIELLKADTSIKRNFYEIESIKNCWSVRELQRAMNSMLFERTGLSTNKQAVLNKQINKERLLPEEVF
ncbi:MAG: hypothetical protein H7Y07_05845 [Pyrinomonadaceae bacterium]|nr:hypothetical protein [Sphingobacteriaceae bacterium]